MKNNISNSTALAVVFAVSITGNAFLAGYVYLTATDRLIQNYNGQAVVSYQQADIGQDDFLTQVSKRGR